MTHPNASQTPWRAEVIQDFARSELFQRTFQEGMDLVEETAAYLDGGGRQSSKLLSRNAALAYAAESMRLTTRLMQVASWLLVQRAVREGDMEAQDACDDKYRLAPVRGGEAGEAVTLPDGLLNLLDRSNRLYERISHMDRRMFAEGEVVEADINPVMSQLQMLQTAFGGE